MQIKNYIKAVEDSPVYKEWIEKNPGYYLVHVFYMTGQDPHVGYYSSDSDEVVTFTIGDEIAKSSPEESFKECGIIEKLDKEKVGFDLDVAMEEANKLREEKDPSEAVDSDMLILQTLEGEPLYNITLITKSFNFINIRIRATDKKILDYKKNSILDLKE